MFARPFALLLLIGSLVAPAWAQEQRGSIEGVVKDASGAVLPGATVEATSAVGPVASTTTDAQGAYRFPALAPGQYRVNANLQGFVAKEVVEVRVGLGQIKKVDFALPLAGVAETVTVTAETPLVDVRQSSRQTNIRAEQVELLPHGRDFTTMVTQAPGANQEAKLGGISIDGASAGENRFIIDGIETTNLQTGLSGTNLIADFVEEVQVKSSGFSAEFGGALGGVISAVTKSGTNNLDGMALYNFQGSATEGRRRADAAPEPHELRHGRVHHLRRRRGNAPRAGLRHRRPDQAGSPVVLRRLPALDHDHRSHGERRARSTQKENVQNLTGNLTAQPANSLRARLAVNSSSRDLNGLLPALNGTDPVGTNYSKRSKFPNYSTSGNADWVASPNFLVSLRAGYRSSDQHDTNVTEEPLFIFSGSNNINYLDTPANLQHGTSFQNIPSNTKVTRDQQTRLYFQADSTVYGRMAGEHQVKFGIQADTTGNNVLRGEVAQSRDHPLEWRALDRRARDARDLRLLLGPQQRGRAEAGPHHRGRHLARRCSASSSRTRGPSTTS